MAGIKGLRYGRLNAQRHDARLRDRDVSLEKRFHADVAARRDATVRIPFGHGYIVIRDPRRFTLEECQAWYEMGFQVPLDLVPWDYWKDRPVE